ncbi:alpha-L-rhamnosidase [Klebsiella pneumoniae]
MLSIIQLTLNYVSILEGVESLPLIGWKISSNNSQVVQSSYFIEIGTDESFNNIIFSSGEIFSEQSNNIELNNISLQFSFKYFVRVKITDNHGEISPWSAPATFITGLPGDLWSAEFISAEDSRNVNNAKGTMVRKVFDIKDYDQIASAFIHCTALGVYKLFLNNAVVGEDVLTPGWTSYKKHLVYQTYDIKSYIQSGQNAIGAMLGAGWFKGDIGFHRKQARYGDRTAFICELVINYKDGSRVNICTDQSWSGDDSAVISSEIYDGEIYDARKEQHGWSLPGFDQTKWRTVQTIEWDKSVLKPQGTCTIKKKEKIFPVKVLTTPRGETVIDFGQNLSGWVVFNVTGQSGDKVILKHFEVLDADGNVYLDNLRTAKQTIEYTLRGDQEETYSPYFTWQGFQYVQIVKWPGDFSLSSLYAQVIHSDMEQIGYFCCSNDELNQLHHNILWGLKGNFIDVPTDCPQRDERLGWTGDAQVFCRTASYLMQTRNFFSKWLVDLRKDQLPNGGVPHVIPDILSQDSEESIHLSNGTDSSAAWSDAAVIIPWTMYLMYADVSILREQYASMKGWVDFMQSHSKDNNWSYKLQFGDWVALDAKEGSYFGATPNDLICMAYYAWSCELLAKTAAVLNNEIDHHYYSTLHREIVKSYQDEYFTPSGRLAARTQTAHILSLCFNLVPKHYKERTINTLVELLQESDGHLVTGFVGTPYFCHALSQNGREAEAWQLLLKDDFPSWLYQVKAGATTIWEHWDGVKPDGSMWSPDMNSFNHYAYGAIGEWLYRVAAGIELDMQQPGFKHINIQPHIGGGLSWLNASHDSLYGRISVSWEFVQTLSQSGNVLLTVEIPPNTSATITLRNAKVIFDSNNISFNRVGAHYIAEINSGRYVFVYSMS